ncbi:MAG: energy transducer TonB [Gemmatimonadales bacterium]
MFETLIESKPKKQKTLGQTVFSVIFHGLLIFGAVKVTANAADRVQEILQDTTMIFLEAPKETPPPPEQPPPDAIVSANPPPKGFQTVVAPTEIPTEIPPVNLNERALDPKDFTGKGVEGGIAAGIEGGTGPVDIGQTFLEAQVDDPPQLISAGPLIYPPAMKAAGIPGKVTLQFIVDANGRVEAGSIKVLNSTHRAFEEAAKNVILKSVYKPGKVRGDPVRVLVQQTINFQLQS